MPNTPSVLGELTPPRPDIELLRARGYVQLKNLPTSDGMPNCFYIHPVDDTQECRTYYLYDDNGNPLPVEPIDYADLALVPEDLEDLKLLGQLQFRTPQADIPGTFYIYPVDRIPGCRTYILYDLEGKRLPLNPVDLAELASVPEDEQDLQARGVYRLQTPREGVPERFYIYPAENTATSPYILYDMTGKRVPIEPLPADALVCDEERPGDLWAYSRG